MEDGGADKFAENVASSLGVPKGDVQVMDLQSGSVIVDYNIYINANSPYTLEELIARQ